jgi:hypothetical protein
MSSACTTNGRDKLLAELRWLHSDRFRNTQIRDLGHSVRFLSPAVAVVHMRWEMQNDSGMPGLPTENGVRRSIFTNVAQRTREGWRFVASQNTDAVAMPTEMRNLPRTARTSS